MEGAHDDLDYQWNEVRLSGKLPERRSNHCSFIVNDYLYIHGGRDIKEGPMNSMWKLSINGVQDLKDHQDQGVCWEPVGQKGTVPANISHHQTAVFGHSVVIFGGISDFENSKEVYEFDATKCAWSKLKQTGDIPMPRDDHSLSQIDDESFLIFGGFVMGSRVNECYHCKKNGGTLEWKKIAEGSPDKPCIRASQSSCIFNGKCYIFGGQDDFNNKLGDLWELDLATETYREILPVSEDAFCPTPRSGHTSTIHNGKMYVFGGILELTKELNELLVYDFATGKYSSNAMDSQNQDLDQIQSNQRTREDESPSLRRNTMNASKKAQVMGASPTKTMGGSTMQKQGALKTTTRKTGKSPTKKDAHDKQEKKESGLASPTSISMQNSFIIKNADESFDAYHQQMRKRKLAGTNVGDTMGGSMGGGNSATMTGSPAQNEFTYAVVSAQPSARDGHSAQISEDGLLFVFGGDRHLMPFNDLYIMSLS